jgi:hypothetical protein
VGVNVRKRNGAWWVFINHRGRRRAKRIGDRPTAERVAAEIRARLQLGDMAVLAPTKQDPTLAVYSERWLEAHSVNINPGPSSCTASCCAGTCCRSSGSCPCGQ